MRFVTFETAPGPGMAAGREDAPGRTEVPGRGSAPGHGSAPGRTSVGIVHGDQVVDLSHASCAALLGGTPPTMQALLDAGLAQWVERLRTVRFDADAMRPLDGTRLLAPLPRPGKIVGAAFNYTDALAERGMSPPAEPVTFVRSGRTVIGPDEPILIAPDAGHVGYEAELAVVIGRLALRVPRERALDYVAGYTAHNDVSGIDLTKRDGGFIRGKNMPATSPLGPWIVSADEIADPQRLAVRLDMDGRRLQDGTTATMLYGVAELIAWVSQRMPLEPGDVIATGTPAGVSSAHTPPAWLVPGVSVTVEVDGVGRLQNPVHAGEPFLEH